MKAVHFICRRAGHSLNNLNKVEGDTYISGCWDVSEEDVKQLEGGWIYLHPEGKNNPSAFGGKILSISQNVRENKSKEKGYDFKFQATIDAKDKPWRGRSDAMAHGSGLVECSFKHEQN